MSWRLRRRHDLGRSALRQPLRSDRRQLGAVEGVQQAAVEPGDFCTKHGDSLEYYFAGTGETFNSVA